MINLWRKILVVLIIVFFVYFFLENNNVNIEKRPEKRGVFVSYIELSHYLKGMNKEQGITEINKIVNNLKKMNFNMIILQVRTFSDAIYPSTIYPWSETITGQEGVSPGYDILKAFIDIAHKNSMELHAWINPYRIRGDEDATDLAVTNPAFSYLNSDMVCFSDGIFYNPAKEEVKQLIVAGVEEIVKKYSVDGILFDDYFYPNLDVDLNDYNDYKKMHPDVSISEYRLFQVSDLIQRVYKVCHKNKVLFGISPDGNINNNYQKHFADVKKWGSNAGYVDYLMPQIYYGFYNEARAFYDSLKEWGVITSKVSLMPALAFYKVGTVDNYAKGGKEEWLNNNDIIMREVLLSRNLDNYTGFSLFRYDYLFNVELKTKTTMQEVKNIKKILK